jgi:hypothetical protein
MIMTESTVPYKIPAHFFERNIPCEDIYISGHHAYQYKHEWKLPVWTEGIEQVKEWIGKEMTYYHIQLQDYPFDKLICNGLVIDSWNAKNQDIL